MSDKNNKIPNSLDNFYNSSKFYYTKEFKELQDKWYKKLKNDGFSDLEYVFESKKNPNHGYIAPFLRQINKNFKNLDQKAVHRKLEYFTSCTSFTNLHKFPSRLHKFIWEQYSQGVSYRKMLPKITARGFKKRPSIFWICQELKKLKKEFELWQLDQPVEPQSLEQFMSDNSPID